MIHAFIVNSYHRCAIIKHDKVDRDVSMCITKTLVFTWTLLFLVRF